MSHVSHLTSHVTRLALLALLALPVMASAQQTEDPRVKEAKGYYDLARNYDEGWQMRLAELYYRKAYETLGEEPSADWFIYADAGYRYAYLLDQHGDMEGALKVAGDLLSKDIRLCERASILTLMGDCQLRLGDGEEAKRTFAKAYEVRTQSYGSERNGQFNMVVMCFCIVNAFMEISEYDEAARWLGRMEEEFAAYEQDGNEKTIREYKAHIAMLHARILLATGHAAEADAVFDAIPDNGIFNPLSISGAAEYLMKARRYSEAADMYARLDTTFAAIDSARITLEKIGECLAPRYIALRRAGRVEEALAVADMMAESVDTALLWQKHSDAAELAVIYQTHEKDLAVEESRAKAVIYQILAVTALLMLLLVGYILWRVRRYNGLLKEKNRLLYQQISKLEKAEEEVREVRVVSCEQKAVSGEERTHNQQIYDKLCELMRNPEVYTDAEANHETLARLAGTNYKYVYDALRECAGLTPADFINQHRMRYAAHLLATTDDPVGLVAEQCGFTNRSTFARLFREHYSMTPTEYRNAAR